MLNFDFLEKYAIKYEIFQKKTVNSKNFGRLKTQKCIEMAVSLQYIFELISNE